MTDPVVVADTEAVAALTDPLVVMSAPVVVVMTAPVVAAVAYTASSQEPAPAVLD